MAIGSFPRSDWRLGGVRQPGRVRAADRIQSPDSSAECDVCGYDSEFLPESTVGAAGNVGTICVLARAALHGPAPDFPPLIRCRCIHYLYIVDSLLLAPH